MKYLPTPSMIRAECLRIQEGWTGQERESRSVYGRVDAVVPVVYGEPWLGRGYQDDDV